ncbi:MAG: metal ABC transporter permease [Rickettsiales bacterium]|nr:metal ABC transporter permease [Rickettsiales bacterium]
MYELLIKPFLEYEFMRRALVACIVLSFSAAPLGIFLVLRRMSLIGDAISHAILPGAAIAFLFFGLSLWSITIGGLIASLVVATSSGILTRITNLKEDASFTGIYLISLAFGVLLISVKGDNIDLMNVLFGNILAIDRDALFLITTISSISLLTFATIYRHLIIECVDSLFMKSVGGKNIAIHQIFLILIVINLVCAFQALGTLMAIGIMILPAIATNFWSKNIDIRIMLSVMFAIFSAYIGLLLSYYYDIPTGPTIVLVAGTINVFSVIYQLLKNLKNNH